MSHRPGGVGRAPFTFPGEARRLPSNKAPNAPGIFWGNPSLCGHHGHGRCGTLRAGVHDHGHGQRNARARRRTRDFCMDSKDAGTSGAMAAMIGKMGQSGAAGGKFTEPFLQVTSSVRTDAFEPMWSGRGRGWNDWGYWGVFPETVFTTHYSGKAIAKLQGPGSQRLRCRFHLNTPAAGMGGGGQGECQFNHIEGLERGALSVCLGHLGQRWKVGICDTRLGMSRAGQRLGACAKRFQEADNEKKLVRGNSDPEWSNTLRPRGRGRCRSNEKDGCSGQCDRRVCAVADAAGGVCLSRTARPLPRWSVKPSDKCDPSQNGLLADAPQRHSATRLRRAYGHRRAADIAPQLTSTPARWLLLSDVRHHTDRPPISARVVFAFLLTHASDKGYSPIALSVTIAGDEHTRRAEFPRDGLLKASRRDGRPQIAARGVSSKSCSQRDAQGSARGVSSGSNE
jgi:hypothetical protein